MNYFWQSSQIYKLNSKNTISTKYNHIIIKSKSLMFYQHKEDFPCGMQPLNLNFN